MISLIGKQQNAPTSGQLGKGVGFGLCVRKRQRTVEQRFPRGGHQTLMPLMTVSKAILSLTMPCTLAENWRLRTL